MQCNCIATLLNLNSLTFNKLQSLGRGAGCAKSSQMRSHQNILHCICIHVQCICIALTFRHKVGISDTMSEKMSYVCAINEQRHAMNTKHTPGPWETNRQSGITYVWQGGTSNAIAKVYVDVNEDSEANARLIAAAPELLEYLEYTCNLLSRLPRLSDADRIDAPGEAASVLKSARSAISKATGETI